MGRPLPVPPPVDELRAKWNLCELAAFSREPDTPLTAALVELKRRHHARPLAPLDAYRAARQVLDAHDGRAAFATWRRAHGGSGAHWPTAADRGRVRAVG